MIAIVDELFHDVVIDEMTTKTFYCLVGDCVGQDRMNKKVKRTIKKRLAHLMEEEIRKGSKASATTKEEDKKEKKERRSTRDSKLTEKVTEYLGREKRGLESGEDTEKNDGSNRSSSEYEKSKSSNPHPPSNNNAGVIFKINEIDVEGTLYAAINSKNDISKRTSSLGKQWHDKLSLQEQQQIDYGINALLYMVAARRIFDYVVLQRMANEEGDGVEYRRRSKRQ